MATYDDFSFLDVTVRDRIATVLCDGPDPQNALVPGGHTELVEVWPRLDADDDVDVVIVSGAGDNFCPGPAPETFQLMATGGMNHVMTTMQEVRDLVVNAINFSKPTVCALNGTSVGGPFAFAMLNDFVIAERHVVFSDLHVPSGVAAGDGGIMIWPLRAGMMNARKALLLGEVFDAEAAERIGLISEVVDTGRSKARAMEYAQKLLATPKAALRHTKRALNELLRQALPAFDLSWAGEIMTASVMDPDAAAHTKPE